MYKILRPYLFRMDPERAHALTLRALQLAGDFLPARKALQAMYSAPSKPVEAFGLKFKNPVGLAAGYDKDGIAIRGLGALGFGHVEIGTVTPRPQPGNPSPRLFRLTEDEAVINRMGFPSRGSQFVQMRLNPALMGNFIERFLGMPDRRRKKGKQGFQKRDLILGVNVGRNKDTPNEEAALDYVALVDNFAPYADYITVNISSPNTAGLRDLQAKAALEDLLGHIHQQRLLSEKQHEKKLPILVKLAPDLSETQLDEAVEAVLNANMNGIIVTNTTLSRDGLRSSFSGESGGLSGSPLAARSEAVLGQTLRFVNGKIPVVSAGGIMNPSDAKRRLEMGAALVQVYTGLVYHGPALAREILKAL